MKMLLEKIGYKTVSRKVAINAFKISLEWILKDSFETKIKGSLHNTYLTMPLVTIPGEFHLICLQTVMRIKKVV